MVKVVLELTPDEVRAVEKALIDRVDALNRHPSESAKLAAEYNRLLFVRITEERLKVGGIDC